MKKNYRKAFKEIEVIDKNSGEIIDSKIQSVKWGREPDYIKLYIDDLVTILGLNGTANKVLLALIYKMNYDGEVVLTRTLKKDVAERLGLQINTIEHNITSLIKQNIFIKKGINYFLVNPHYFARGNWEDIKAIRLTITYDKNGRAIQKTEFDGQTVLPFAEEESKES